LYHQQNYKNFFSLNFKQLQKYKKKIEKKDQFFGRNFDFYRKNELKRLIKTALGMWKATQSVRSTGAKRTLEQARRRTCEPECPKKRINNKKIFKINYPT